MKPAKACLQEFSMLSKFSYFEGKNGFYNLALCGSDELQLSLSG